MSSAIAASMVAATIYGIIPLSGKRGESALRSAPCRCMTPCGMIAHENFKAAGNAASNREAFREKSNNRHCRRGTGDVGDGGAGARASRRSSSAAFSTCPGLTPISPAPGTETAAKMAVEDFGGEVLGRKVEIVAADHLNKADLAASIARDMLDNQGVEMLYDVAASATALAAGEIAKARNKIVMFQRPRPRSGSATRPAAPIPCIMPTTPLRRPTSPGSPPSSQGLETWFFLTADYAFGQDLEKDTTNVVVKAGGKVLGGVKHPLNTSDFSSFLLQAQSFEGQGRRTRQCRRRHHQRDQAGGRIRTDQERRPETLAAARLRHRHRQRWA